MAKIGDDQTPSSALPPQDTGGSVTAPITRTRPLDFTQLIGADVAEGGTSPMGSRFYAAYPEDDDDIFGEAGFGMEAAFIPPEMQQFSSRFATSESLKEGRPQAAPAAAAPEAPAAEGGFEYGWCYTDHKTGKEIRRSFRGLDYMKDEPYASRVAGMLDKLGLPMPDDKEIFRGTHHDLLFLNSHGVVLRIGPQDVEDLINPGILQPLGWLEDQEVMAPNGKDMPLTVAIYPGVELYDHYIRNPDNPPLAGDLIRLMKKTKQSADDIHGDGNTGIIRVRDDDGTEVAVHVVIDADNIFNSPTQAQRQKRNSAMSEITGSAPAAVRKADVLLNTLSSVFNSINDTYYWQKAYEVHQPLRKMFWDAFQDVLSGADKPDEEKRDAFWRACAAVTNKPTQVNLPVWRVSEDPKGKMSFAREEIKVPNMVLYRPWTGEAADVVKPITQPEGLRNAVAKAHGDMQKGNLGERVRDLGRRLWNELRNF